MYTTNYMLNKSTWCVTVGAAQSEGAWYISVQTLKGYSPSPVTHYEPVRQGGGVFRYVVCWFIPTTVEYCRVRCCLGRLDIAILRCCSPACLCSGISLVLLCYDQPAMMSPRHTKACKGLYLTLWQIELIINMYVLCQHRWSYQ